MQNKVWILLVLTTFILSHSTAVGFCFKQAGKTYQISPVLIKTIALVESGLDPLAVNQNRNGSYDIGRLIPVGKNMSAADGSRYLTPVITLWPGPGY